MRTRLAAHDAAAPWFGRFSITDDPRVVAGKVPYPCVLKPTNLSASRGVIRADDAAAFADAFVRCASIVRAARAASDWILVEAYCPGQEVAVEGVVTDGTLRVLAVFDKPDPLTGPTFEETMYVTPSRLNAAALTAIEQATARAIAGLGLEHGPIHAELRWDGARATLLEIAPRSIGGLCSRALRFNDGTSLETILLRHALGESLAHVEREAGAAGVMMLPIEKAGRLVAVRGQERALRVAGIEDVRVTVPVGDTLVPLPEGSRYLGFVFARAARPADVEAALRSAQRALEFEVESPSIAAPTAAGDLS
jgi:biotin carboxylase